MIKTINPMKAQNDASLSILARIKAMKNIRENTKHHIE
jgi:hypothetical protein